MSTAINVHNFALVNVDDVESLLPPEDWIIDPVFDDPDRAFVVGPSYWVITGNNVHVKTEQEIDEDPVSLSITKASVIDSVNTLRATKFTNGFTDGNGVRWSSTPTDIANINAVCTLIAVGVVTGDQMWRDADNIDHTLTPAEVIALAGAMAAFGKTCYAVSWFHKANVEALITVSAVLSYDYTTGWPS